MTNKNEIIGSGPDYYKNMSLDSYRGKVNSPAENREYAERYHIPMVTRAKEKFGSPIHVLSIACGPADELNFIKNDPDTKIIATDFSSYILTHAKKALGEGAGVFTSDANSPALKENIAEAGILVNAMIYAPDKMLEAMYNALKPGAQCTLNFRTFSLVEQERGVFGYFLEHGGKVLDRELPVQTRGESRVFNVKVLDYSETTKAGSKMPDLERRQLKQQIFFMSLDDMRELAKLMGFKEIEYSRFVLPGLHKIYYVLILEKP
ncbi:MAG: hypothetical protein UW02_C0001G0003 [Candidatus Nomurabacteria bacterium GW2011_GWB1_43_7]|uniref:Methyltransferase domain-containing protein n=1 Tax=Candidatus Nomurabacteria bacterium GW2011_GWB1_43_7 TaxID=1618747 RepID=A0A0G1FCV7_9BACT|nr:MAG: hypothetical protein UW02_C0001G0003 [Candidatus Nomurabacteria bacterium GW2011_GWB1_43_7]